MYCTLKRMAEHSSVNLSYNSLYHFIIMKKNFFIAFFALVLVMPSWATGVITGSDTLHCVDQYYINGIYGVDSVKWSFTPNFPLKVILSNATYSSVTLTRGKYLVNSGTYAGNYTLYTGTITLKAKVYFANGLDSIFQKTITLPSTDEIPRLPAHSIGKITYLLPTRTYTISNCTGVSDSSIKWAVRLPPASTDSIFYGRSWTVTPTCSGTLTIHLYNEELCTAISNDISVTIDLHKPFDPLLLFPNPVITNTVEVQVVDQSYANRGSNETTEARPAIDYTLELWNENYGLLKTITSSISGEKDVVTLDLSNWHNGIYFLTMKVNNQVVKTNKLILNR